MLKDLARLGGVVKQAVEMKERMEQVNASLGAERLKGQAGGGMVTIELSGALEVLHIHIEPELIDPEKSAELETMLRAALNDGITRAQALVKERMEEVAGGIDIPGLTS